LLCRVHYRRIENAPPQDGGPPPLLLQQTAGGLQRRRAHARAVAWQLGVPL